VNISIKAKMGFLLFVILTIGLLMACSTVATSTPECAEMPPASPNPDTNPQITNPEAEKPSNTTDRVDVVYFHRANQCHCMQVIEENIHNTVLLNFQKELDSGKLTFTSLASDDRANAAMVKKYNTGLFGLFITIVKGKTEKIVPVEEIWSMTGDEVKYKEYVKNIIAQSLEGEL